MDINKLDPFVSEWWVVACPEGADAGTVERILEGAVKSAFPRMLWTGRPPYMNNGVLNVTVGLGMIPSMDRQLLAKAVATKAAEMLTSDYTIAAVHLEETGQVPGVPLSKDKVQNEPFPGRDRVTGESKGTTPSGMGDSITAGLAGAKPLGSVVVDFEIKGRL